VRRFVEPLNGSTGDLGVWASSLSILAEAIPRPHTVRLTLDDCVKPLSAQLRSSNEAYEESHS